jgi:alpha-ketoglutarate-dependent taurine dioxygenase
MAIEIRKLTPHIGAEIHGIDLSRPLDDAGFAAVHGALMDHSVIFFRDQDITVDQQKEFGRRFGELHIHPAAPGVLAGHPEILVIHADEHSKRVAGEEWHSDVSCDPEPPMGSVLHITELPPVGGDTLFASMYAAYETLSPEMQRFLCGLTAVHDGEHVYRGRYNYDAPRDGAARAIRQPRVHHAHRRAQARGERRRPPDAVPPRRDPGAPLPLPVGAPVHRVLGQPVRAAPRDVGLLPAAPARQPRDDPGRQAVLPAVTRARA